MVYDNTFHTRLHLQVEETIYVAFLLVVIIIFLFCATGVLRWFGSGYSCFACGAFFCNVLSGFSVNVPHHACRCIVGGTCGG